MTTRSWRSRLSVVRVVGVVEVSTKALMTMQVNLTIEKIRVNVCNSKEDVTIARESTMIKIISQMEVPVIVTSLHSRQQLGGHRTTNTIRRCLTAVQAAICKATEAIS